MPDIDIEALRQAQVWLHQDKAVALAWVTKSWGSAPRPPGACLAVAEDGSFAGSVSGGCVEGDVIAEALEVMAAGTFKSLRYGVTHNRAWEAGLACGGTIELCVHPCPERAVVDDMIARYDARQPFVAALDLNRGHFHLWTSAAAPSPLLADALATALQTETTARISEQPEAYVLIPFAPRLRLVIVGAVHIAQALCPMATLAGYAVTIIDPRPAFASRQRFPDTTLVHAWPDEALRTLKPDDRTAIVALTHDPKLDEAALEAALASKAFYIGALGSRKTQAARRRRLRAGGHDAAALDRIHGPVGLAIGARGPAEIAVAILAEMTAALRGVTAGGDRS